MIRQLLCELIHHHCECIRKERPYLHRPMRMPCCWCGAKLYTKYAQRRRKKRPPYPRRCVASDAYPGESDR